MSTSFRKVADAIRRGDLIAFAKLIGPQEIIRNEPDSASAFGSWLHFACMEGQLGIVRYLVENGADVNLRAGTFDA
jgi:ankyrin repeat protein